MEWKAKAKFARYAPRKVQQVLDTISRKRVSEAFKILQFIPNVSATLVEKTLKSAVANSGRLKNPEGLSVKEAWVGQGTYLKRFRARAFGRAVTYRRKTCHLTVVVSDGR